MATTLRRQPKLTGDLLGLIDYDIVTYSAGHASDNKYYVAPDGKDFQYKKDVVRYCTENDLDELDIQMVIEPAPIEHCLFTVKQMVFNIANDAGCGKYKGFLTGKDNFRETIDATQLYKGHRPNNKPHWYNEIKEYLVKHQNGIIVNGYEADDAMAMAQCEADEGTTIICTKDKDLWMVPGWKYDWGRETKFYVTPIEGLRWFYTQLLTGDSTDNIMGCGSREIKEYKTGARVGESYNARNGVGKESAALILSACDTELEMYEEVLACYLDYDLNEYDLLENANLLWMVRKEGQHWVPPK